MPSRRLEDRIRDLCAKVLTARGSELDSVVSELQACLHQHAEEFRKMAADHLGGRKPQRENRRSIQ